MSSIQYFFIKLKRGYKINWVN